MSGFSERVLYFDCFSGVAGDMTLGALLDLGVDVDALRAALQTLPVGGWTLGVETTRKMGLRGLKVHIEIGGQEEGAAAHAPEHDHEHTHDLGHTHAHGHEQTHDHDHDHDHAHAHDHDHGPAHDHDHGPAHDHAAGHPHYHYADIVRIIEGGRLPTEVVERALSAFEQVALAEARVHGISKEDVHFHEVGAVDSILDIVGSAWGIWQLGVTTVESAPPPMGRGFIRCEHGRMPSPAPATLEILRGVPITPAVLDRELVTPTGAAFVKAWARRVGPFPEMTVERVGFGAGNADFPDRPNLLRLVLGDRGAGAPLEGTCHVVEANLDDLSPEIAGFLLERLFEVGARDAWFVPLHMKKNRPGFLVGALVDHARSALVEAVLLTESSTLGLRRYPVSRLVLERRSERVDTPWGAVNVKLAYRDGVRVNVAPEYEDCVRLARGKNVALKDVYQHAIAAFLTREGTGTPK